MKKRILFDFLHKQIPLLLTLSLIPGLVYLFMGWLAGRLWPALIWYGAVILAAIYGRRLYLDYRVSKMAHHEKMRWYRKLRMFLYLLFSLWTVIFLLYCDAKEHGVYAIAIFTQIGAAVIASTLLISDRKLYYPILMLLLFPLGVYFFLIGEWYGYILAIFTLIFLIVLIYSANSSYALVMENYYRAQHDTLTGLYNRNYLIEYLEQCTKETYPRPDHCPEYLLLLDLDHFKTINDTLGHLIGDSVLKEVAERLRSVCGTQHAITRLGGDEFTIFSHGCRSSGCDEKSIVDFAQKLLDAIKAPYCIGEHHLYLSASIGITKIDPETADIQQFVKEADIAMYEAKARGRNHVIVFNEALEKQVAYHLEVERRLYFALEHHEFSFVYQPQFGKDQQLVGCEVLVRWYNEELGHVSPAEFIAIAEKTGVIVELGEMIVASAFETLSDWEKKGIVLSQFSINISTRQFLQPDFVGKIKELYEKHFKVPPRATIVFEITESVAIDDIETIVNKIRTLEQWGIVFSLDDFGTGYSSLGILRQLPLYELKLDKSFVDEISETRTARDLVVSILNIAKTFGFSTVSEGIETEKQFQFLLKNGCDMFQGYYFSKPLTKEVFERKFLHKAFRPKQLHAITYDI